MSLTEKQIGGQETSLREVLGRKLGRVQGNTEGTREFQFCLLCKSEPIFGTFLGRGVGTWCLSHWFWSIRLGNKLSSYTPILLLLFGSAGNRSNSEAPSDWPGQGAVQEDPRKAWSGMLRHVTLLIDRHTLSTGYILFPFTHTPPIYLWVVYVSDYSQSLRTIHYVPSGMLNARRY